MLSVSNGNDKDLATVGVFQKKFVFVD